MTCVQHVVPALRPALFVIAAAAACAAGAFAQPSPIDSLIDRRISSVVVEAEGQPVTSADVLGLVDTRVGEPLAMAAVRESVLHLSSIGRFDRVDVEGQADGSGVAVTYRLVETRRVSRVDFRGSLGVSTRRLRQALGGRAVGVPSPDRLRAAERSLRTFYESLGYFNPTISSAVQDRPDPTRSRLVYTLDAGPRSRIGRIEVNAEGIDRAQVLSRLRLRSG